MKKSIYKYILRIIIVVIFFSSAYFVFSISSNTDVFTSFYFRKQTGGDFFLSGNDKVFILPNCSPVFRSLLSSTEEENLPYVNFGDKTKIQEKNISKIQNEKEMLFNPEENCYWVSTQVIGSCHNSECDFEMYSKRFKIAILNIKKNTLYVSKIVYKKKTNYIVEVSLQGFISLKSTLRHSFSLLHFYFFLVALIFSLFIKRFIARIYVKKKRLSKKITKSVFLGTIITFPFVWFIFPILDNFFYSIFLAGVFVFVFETFFIFYRNKGEVSLIQAFLLSFLTNILSLGISLFIFQNEFYFYQFMQIVTSQVHYRMIPVVQSNLDTQAPSIDF